MAEGVKEPKKTHPAPGLCSETAMSHAVSSGPCVARGHRSAAHSGAIFPDRRSDNSATEMTI
jgi:hypothetical protein